MAKLSVLLALVLVLIRSAAALAGSEEAMERNDAGVKLLQEGKVDAAIEEFRKSVGLDSQLLAARLNLAYTYERAGKIPEAIGEYRAAIDAQPENFYAHNNLGVLLDKKGLYDEAIAEFQSALSIEPGNSTALKNLDNARKSRAIVKEREGQIASAEKQAQAQPQDPRAAYQVARLHAFYGNKELALQWLGKAVRQGYKDLADVKVDPAFQSIREEREFGLLLQRK